MSGGKEELCDLTHDAVEALNMLPHTMRVEFNDVTVKRDWLHPWTSEISYTEDRSLTIRGANVRLSTTSDDVITLVQTFSGVKLQETEEPRPTSTSRRLLRARARQPVPPTVSPSMRSVG